MKICKFNDETVCIDCHIYCDVEFQREENKYFCDGKCLCSVCKNE